jgi:hypothetical protein
VAPGLLRTIMLCKSSNFDGEFGSSNTMATHSEPSNTGDVAPEVRDALLRKPHGHPYIEESSGLIRFLEDSISVAGCLETAVSPQREGSPPGNRVVRRCGYTPAGEEAAVTSGGRTLSKVLSKFISNESS